MVDQRIYYVPPRLAGPIAGWSGKDAPGASWLLDHVSAMGFNALWFSPLCVTSAVEKIARGQTLSGSYYAIRDHFRIDPEFSSGKDASDRAHLQHFCLAAKKKGLRVYADLVFNHVAADHPLVLIENDTINDMRKIGFTQPLYGTDGSLVGIQGTDKTLYFKFKRNPDYSLEIGGEVEDPWSDVAQINYISPEAWDFFIARKDAYFKRVIDWYAGLGFSGFRCDVAYMIPPEAWQELIAHAKRTVPDGIFLAETLGHHQAKVADLAFARVNNRPAFDLGMLGTYWWNMTDDWLPKQENPRIQSMSRYGGAGSPDNHDTKDTLAGGLVKLFNGMNGHERHIAAACLRDYAVATLVCASSYMQMGFEYCNTKQNGVFRGMVNVADWPVLMARAGSALDISKGILAINQLKHSLGVENCRVEFSKCQEMAGGKLVKIVCDYIDVDTGKKTAALALVMTKQPENGAVPVPEDIENEMNALGLIRNTTVSVAGVFSVYHTRHALARDARNQMRLKS